jgi:hypothetical protein
MDLVLTERPFTEQDVLRLESAFLKEEQVDCPVTHHFGPGVYIREVLLPAGAYIIGHAHKDAHLNVMLEGRLTIIKDDGTRREMTAPQTFVSKPGRKIAYIHETVRWQNIYATPETDVDKLETLLFDKSAVFVESQALLTHDHDADRNDFALAIAEYGYDEATVAAISESEVDQTPFPPGSYKVAVMPSAVHGRGLFATSDIAANELIAPARLGGKRTPAGRYTNHSATPNAEMVRAENGDVYLFSKEMILGCKGGSIGGEITIDYRHALSLTLGAY